LEPSWKLGTPLEAAPLAPMPAPSPRRASAEAPSTFGRFSMLASTATAAILTPEPPAATATSYWNPLRSQQPPCEQRLSSESYSLAAVTEQGRTLDFWSFSEHPGVNGEGKSGEEESMDAIFQMTMLTPCAGVVIAMTTWATARRTQKARTRGMLPLNTQRESEQKLPRPFLIWCFLQGFPRSSFWNPLGNPEPPWKPQRSPFLRGRPHRRGGV